jgi:HAD superfamily hydrolase (TIGR01509 family)
MAVSGADRTSRPGRLPIAHQGYPLSHRRGPARAAGTGRLTTVIGALIFDLDGVLIDSEPLWDAARRELVERTGGRWSPNATEAMMGMSSKEWSVYLRDELGVSLDASEINNQVVERLLAHYRVHLPLIPGAVDAVTRMSRRWPLGLASSSNRIVIDAVLSLAGIDELFEVTVSSEEVPRGKPAPDVYLEAARRLGLSPPSCAVAEDSPNGVRAAVAAGMTVVAIPAPYSGPPPDFLTAAAVVLDNIGELTPDIFA